MKNVSRSEPNFTLWGLIGEVNHSILLIRQKELNQYQIPVRQYELLRAIQALGSNVTLTRVAKLAQREVHVVSRQTIGMEKDGLITRTKNVHKSTLLTLKITDKGNDIIKTARHSKSINSIFSILTTQEREQMESILGRISVETKKYNND
jgi:DNA-binding MarR family transcriptional regulator